MVFSHISLYLRSSCCSKLFFVWNALYLCKTLKRPKLTPHDLLTHPANQSCHSNFIRLSKQWQLQCLSNPASPSLTRAILRTYWVSFLSIALLGFLAESLMGLSFYYMALLIENLVSQEHDEGFKNSGLFCACVVITLLSRHVYIIRNSLLFIQIRQAITSMVYEKTLNLDVKALSEISEGRIINAATSDLVVLDIGHSHVMHLLFEPFVCLINIYLLASLVGFTVIYGFLAMLVFVLLQLFTARCISNLRKKASALTDTRLKLLSDTVSGIRSVKAYGWELLLKERIDVIRNRETSVYLALSFLKSASYTLLRYSSHLAMLIIVCLKTALGETLQAGPIFSVFAALNFLSIFFTMFMGYGITAFAQIKTALNRTAKILLLPEKGNSSSQSSLQEQKPKTNDDDSSHGSFQHFALSFKNASFSWMKTHRKEILQTKKSMKDFETARSTTRFISPRTQEEDSSPNVPILKELNFEMKQGELLAVIGTVGGGKSSLLLSLLGQISLYNGRMGLSKTTRIAYVAQDPFLLAGTIRENILFGSRYAAQKFNYVCRLVCLEEDFISFPKGSRTVIGEGGATLSGGQRARVALARALYSDSDMFLFDDPLSALDPKVTSKILKQVFCKHLAGKTRVIVTQQISVLAKASRILYLREGQTVFLGTFKELQLQNIDLSNIFRTKTGETRKRLPSCQLQSAICQEETEDDACSINFVSQSLKDLETRRDIKESNLSLTRKESKVMGGFSCSTLCSFTSYSCMCCTIPFLFIISLFPALLNLYISEKLREWVALPVKQQLLPEHRQFMVALVFIFLLSHLFRNLVTGYTTVAQTGKLHSLMLKALLRAQVDFFDTTSSGQIMTRFSKDIAVGDSVIPVLSTWFLDVLFTILSTLVVLCFTVPWSIVPVFVLVTLVLLIRLKAMRISTQAMRLNLESRAPVTASLSQTLKGLPSIRSYRKKQFFQRRFEGLVDLNSRAFATYHHVSRALGFYLDALSVVLVVLTTFLAFLVSKDPLLWAFLLQLINSLIGTFQFAARLSADLQNYMTSISRCLQYTQLESEAPLTLKPQNPFHSQKVLPVCFSPRSRGRICFSNVTMRYLSSRLPALKNLSFQIMPGQKVGIVGRTGAGKSSILNALLRLVELSGFGSCGSILIDSEDISAMGLHQLRRTLTVIPQTPFLFKGSLRENLDPEALVSKESDERLMQALYSVGLGEKILSLKKGLDTEADAGESVLSSGEKQLMCLARALLRESKIIILDEATAKIDLQTEAVLQKVIREEFADRTVITIAHRMGNVMESDFVLVMEGGECIERGHPFELLTRRTDDKFITNNSKFAGMVRETGEERHKHLERARQAYLRRNS